VERSVGSSIVCQRSAVTMEGECMCTRRATRAAERTIRSIRNLKPLPNGDNHYNSRKTYSTFYSERCSSDIVTCACLLLSISQLACTAHGRLSNFCRHCLQPQPTISRPRLVSSLSSEVPSLTPTHFFPPERTIHFLPTHSSCHPLNTQQFLLRTYN
jgi:hypothetical protein